MLPIHASNPFFLQVYYLDTNVIFTKTLEKIIEHNNLQNKIQIFNKKEDLLSICDKVLIVFHYSFCISKKQGKFN